jgi:hypothetical protein
VTPAVLWVLLVFVYLPTPHWGVASIEFPYSDTSGNRAPMVSRRIAARQRTGASGQQETCW